MQKIKPLVAFFLFIASLAAYFIPNFSDFLIFDRDLILRGEVWRLFTCHLVHFSFSHLCVDLAVLLSAYLMVDRSQFLNLELVLLYCMALIGPALLLFDLHLARFGGSSALASAVLFFVLIVGYQTSSSKTKVIYCIALFCCVFKTFLEFTLEIHGFVFLPEGVQTVPFSHLLGYLTATGVYIHRTASRAQCHQIKTTSKSVCRGSVVSD
jgi:rhomboid family GlyGly-CTERM serine protease